MKKMPFSLIGITIIALSIQLGAQAPLKARWDYPDTEIASISAFEVKVDGATNYTSVGIPAPETFADTQPGHHTFTYIIPEPISNGNHTFVVRACNQSACSFDTSIVFRQVGPPSNPRIVR